MNKLKEHELMFFLDYFEIEIFFKKILLSNVGKENLLVLNNLLGYILNEDISIIKDKNLKLVLSYIKEVKKRELLKDMEENLNCCISKLEYCSSIIGNDS